MHPAIREKLATLRERHEELNALLADPATAANADPNRLLPLDTARTLEREGAIGRLHGEFLVTVGNGTPVATATSERNSLVAVPSVASTTPSCARKRASALVASTRRASPSTLKEGNARASPSAADSTLSRPTSASRCHSWRCRFVTSTRSASTSVRWPTPARASASEAGQPSPPAPISNTLHSPRGFFTEGTLADPPAPRQLPRPVKSCPSPPPVPILAPAPSRLSCRGPSEEP